MNPLILNSDDEVRLALSTHSVEPGDEGYHPAVPLHSFRDRVKAALLVLKGRGQVIRCGPEAWQPRTRPESDRERALRLAWSGQPPRDPRPRGQR